MKKLFLLFLTVISISSCAIHSGLTSNLNSHDTQVVLAKKNFKILKKVTGEAQADYVFGFGGFTKQGLIAEAREKMLQDANLIGTSKAVINETVEVRQSFFPIFRSYKVFISA